MHLSFAVTNVLLIFCFPGIMAEMEWVTRAEFSDSLPSSLIAFLNFTAQINGECFVACGMQATLCDSVAFSTKLKSCKLFSHPNLAVPLPPLKPDPDGQHQMYYKKWFCPNGWEANFDTKMCYFVGNGAAVQRPLAWQTCEDRLDSELVTFQTAKQRDNLYRILLNKYSNVTKFWTGYAMFQGMWSRPIEEIPGYVKRRGECPGFANDNLVTLTAVSPADCALKCDRTYRDRCVAFTYQRTTSTCMLRRKSCDYTGAASVLLANEYWTYDKVHEGRPVSMQVSVNILSYDLAHLVGVTYNQCYKTCQSIPDCVAFVFRNGDCYTKKASWVDNPAVSSWDVFDLRDINRGPCPYGVRYRDVCLNQRRDSQFFDLQKDMCRRMGGKLGRPVEESTKQWYYRYNLYRFGKCSGLDFGDLAQEGVWKTLYDNLPLTDSVYERWNFTSPEPDGGINENCVMTGMVSSSVFYTMFDESCSGNRPGYAICETPITQSWPQDCLFTPLGREYMGTISITASGAKCGTWGNYPAISSANPNWYNFPEGHTVHNYCRNPLNNGVLGAWCYRNDNNASEVCNIPTCPESDWAPSQSYTDPSKPYAAISYSTSAVDSYDWTVEDVAASANPICSLSMKDWCPYYFRGSCYMFYQRWKTQPQALATCAQNGWHLAVITSVAEWQFISRIVYSVGMQYFRDDNAYYIGLTGSPPSNYTWVTGEPYSFSALTSPSGGSETCVVINENSLNWNDVECSRVSFFICEIEIGK